MKKLITLASLLVATFILSQTAQADEVTIYFQPNPDWASSSAAFKLYGYASSNDLNTAGSIKEMSKFSDDGNGIYSATMDITSYPYIKFGRFNSGYTENWNTTTHYYQPTTSTYYYMTESGFDNWNYYSCSYTTYFPWRYYFMSASSQYSDTWNVDAGVTTTETNGTYTFSFSGVTFAGKRVGWAPGSSFNNDGSLISWDNVCKSKTTANNDDWILFESFSYEDVVVGTTGSAWFVPASGNSQYNDGTITITFNSSSEAATINCSHTVNVGGAGYATYSNSGRFTVEGAEKVYVATGKGDDYVTLTVMDPSTVYATTEVSGNYSYPGIIVKGTGDVTINSAASNAAAYSGSNFLIGSGSNSKSVTDITNAYVFSWDGSHANTVGFYKAETTGTIDEHRAYLDLTGAASRGFFALQFNDETGISDVNATVNEGAIYNLQGVRMSQLHKGLNIMNGKKIMVK